MSDAQYLRKFITSHKSYNNNSIISKDIVYDLVKHVQRIQYKEEFPKELFGDLYMPSL